MQLWNKINLISLVVILLAAAVIFSTIVGIAWYIKAGNALWALPAPLLAIGYGVYAFVKKYYPEMKF